MPWSVYHGAGDASAKNTLEVFSCIHLAVVLVSEGREMCQQFSGHDKGRQRRKPSVLGRLGIAVASLGDLSKTPNASELRAFCVLDVSRPWEGSGLDRARTYNRKKRQRRAEAQRHRFFPYRENPGGIIRQRLRKVDTHVSKRRQREASVVRCTSAAMRGSGATWSPHDSKLSHDRADWLSAQTNPATPKTIGSVSL